MNLGFLPPIRLGASEKTAVSKKTAVFSALSFVSSAQIVKFTKFLRFLFTLSLQLVQFAFS
jgi:hypothetical protein